METKGRKLLRCAAGVMTFATIAGNACVTATAANQIGQIDTAGLLDIHAAASDASEVLGQVMDEGHVAILERRDGWVCIMAGGILGWVPQENLVESEVSFEEAHEANRKVIAEFTEEIEEILETRESEEGTAGTEEVSEKTAERTVAEETAQSLQMTEVWPEAGMEEDVQAETQAQPEIVPKAGTAPQAEAVPVICTEAVQAEGCEEQLQNAQPLPVWEVANVTPEDVTLLANIIYCEAGSEPYVGKVAVGSVVINRVKSERYPATIRDVIYEKGQFSPVRSGRMEKALRNSSADAFCYQAAVEALAGVKPVADKLHFRRVNGRDGLVIGNHVFY